MTAFTYPVILTDDDNGTVLVSFPDIAIAHTFGDDTEDALAHAADALETAIMIFMDERKDIPRPSAARGRPTVTLRPLSAAKVALYRTMRQQGVTKSELARRLDCHMEQVDRILDLRHASKLDQVERALRAVGKELVVSVRDAA